MVVFAVNTLGFALEAELCALSISLDTSIHVVSLVVVVDRTRSELWYIPEEIFLARMGGA